MNQNLGPTEDECKRLVLPKVAKILEQFAKDCADDKRKKPRRKPTRPTAK